MTEQTSVLSAPQFDPEEMDYCTNLVSDRGDDNVGRDPKTISTYLRLQASLAFRARDYVSAARLGQAATLINCDTRNNHNPDWLAAWLALTVKL